MRIVPAPIAATLRVPRRTAFVQVLKTAVAVVLTWIVAGAALHVDVPIFGAIAALLVVQPSVNQSFGRAVERSLGVMAGVLVALGITLLFGRQGWLVLLAVVVVLIGAWALRISSGAGNQAAISALLVLAIGATTPDYALNRILETLIGAVIGVVVNAAIAAPVLLGPAHLATARLGRDIAAALERLADALDTTGGVDGAALLDQARGLRLQSTAAKTALQQGQESLSMNPRRSRHRDVLQADTAIFARLEPIVTQVIGMTRSVRDHGTASLAAEPLSAQVAEECRRAAHDLRSMVSNDDSDAPVEPAALTSPILLPGEQPTEWIVLGALLEDLRRIREEILGEAS